MSGNKDVEITGHHGHVCGPGCHHQQPDADLGSLMRQSVVNTIFGKNAGRRTLLKLLGASTALSLIEQVIPFSSIEALGDTLKTPEKVELTIGFIPISCSAPLLIAAQQGLFKEAGLDVELVKTPGWAVIRDRLNKGDYDAAHVLSPMPLSMSLGIDGPPAAFDLCLIQNTNGQAITLASKHQGRRDPKNWKGFTFGVPFPYSMHNYLLRYYIAESGVNPDSDVTIKAVPPPEMVAQLKAGLLDGFLSPEPFNQLAVQQGVGFIHLLTKDIWNGHPCCGFSVAHRFAEQAPNTYLALLQAVIKAAAFVHKSENRSEVANRLTAPAYLNQPAEVLEAIFTGSFADGLGGTHNEPDRIDFNPVPFPSMGIWMLTQMKRWGFLAKDVNYRQIAEQVFRLADAEKLLKDAGFETGDNDRRPVIMGKTFDAASPEAYLSSFAIRRM
jgi:nitrate/nitrite transport system substrate-binding protein